MTNTKGAGATNTDALHVQALSPRASTNGSRPVSGETTRAIYTAWRTVTAEWEHIPRPMPGDRHLIREQLDAASTACAKAVFLHGLDVFNAPAVLEQLDAAIVAAQRARARKRHPSGRRRHLVAVQTVDPWAPGWAGR